MASCRIRRKSPFCRWQGRPGRRRRMPRSTGGRSEAMGFFRREKIIGGGKPDGFYAGCYRDPDTGERGPEIWLPWLDPVLIVGRNRSGKDTGIIVPNALMNSTAISTVVQDT